MENARMINMGVGFVTGRKNFQKVLRTYMYRWKQTSSAIRSRVKLHLFIAYDLDYNRTEIGDYVNIRPELLEIMDSVFFISKPMIQKEIITLGEQKAVGEKEVALIFDKGYAGHRNAILYYALKKKMDYLIFLDDDEYPLAVTKSRSIPVWSGQDVLTTHLEYLGDADLTNGMHCGYISPIPRIAFNDIITEDDFRVFIEAISNDILEWKKIKRLMADGGVTYANPQVFVENTAREVDEVCRAKFISGSNLGINLKHPERIKPFFNPPNARGEDTFLSTCLTGHKVMRIPCYTFHDGFSIYSHLLDGVLPLQLKEINTDTEKIISRFYRACIGWIRYKPLYLLITRPDTFEQECAAVREKLTASVPKFCAYFGMPQFEKILVEFEKYYQLAPKHHQLFLENQRIWEQIKLHALHQAY